ncbi:uncharacterized protein LOC141723508 [Apium graveolens]|uniref:uncharacterized protein LOC141723508 n=1 Tax=Apium graveolens TaxID=4045 RepID=UPI003D7AF437
MIKRRFFKHEHGDKDAPSDSSSSSSDSDSESEVELDSDNEQMQHDNNAVADKKQSSVPSSSSSGYESEDSSAHEVDLDSPGLPSSEDDLDPAEKGEDVGTTHPFEKKKSGKLDKPYSTKAEKDEIPSDSDLPSCVLKAKSVFKCKICPRIICLTEETLRTHLKSKRHSRSEKLLSEGRLKIMLNSDGELEALEEEETHQERHAATLAAAAAAVEQSRQKSAKAKKNRGRQRQRMRAKKKTGEDVISPNTKATKRPPKKRRQN